MLALAGGFALLSGSSSAVTLLVTSTADSGPGSLRDVIAQAATGHPTELTTIQFAFDSTSIAPEPVIHLLTPLAITSPVEIDGTQNGDATRPGVQLVSSADTTADVVALHFAGGSNGSRVHHLSITHFNPGVAMVIDVNNVQVDHNWLGVALDGSGDANGTGVQANGSFNRIGPQNVIAYNAADGVAIPGAAAANNVVNGNLIGLPPSGITDGEGLAGNQGSGVYIGISPGGNTVGGPTAADRNVIAENAFAGVDIDSTGANTVINNVIGMDTAGTPAPNGRGVYVDGSPNNVIGQPGLGNVIVANFGVGIQSLNAATTIEANSIGVDATGTSTGLGNQSGGVDVSGTGSIVRGNTIGDNGGDGVRADGADITIAGNSIGVNAAGDAHPNSGDGVHLANGSGYTVDGNVIAGNFSDGVFADFAQNVTITGNRIGVTRADTAVANTGDGISLAATSSVQVGGAVTQSQFGTSADVGNVISGNDGSGISLTCAFAGESSTPTPADGTTIQGNRIGADSSGTARRPNGFQGVSVQCATNTLIGGTDASLGNIVAGNGIEAIVAGIFDSGTSDTIQHNLIGVGVGGVGLGNRGAGVEIGSVAPDILDNTIAFNGEEGVRIDAGLDNAVLGNSIHDNGGIGIDLVAPAGPNPTTTPEDPTAPNRDQHYPVLSRAVRTGTGLLVSGTLNSTPSTSFTVEVFANHAADPSGFGEGETPLARFTVTTDATGVATFTNQAVPAAPADEPVITATATDPAKNTSEFSPAVVSTLAATLTTQASGNVPLGGSVTDTATLTGASAPTGTVTFTLYGPNDGSCLATPAFTSSPVALPSGATSVTSPAFTPTAAGVYRWVATYSGDPQNAPVGPTSCSDPAEQVTVLAVPTIATTATPAAATVGTPVHDVATVSGGLAPTGTVSFALYQDAACTTPLFTSATRPLVNGAAASSDFTPSATGTYFWIASYSGDAANAPVAGTCGAANETVTVSPVASTTTTSTTTTLPPSTTTTSTSTTTTLPPTTTTTSTSTTTTLPPPTTTLPTTTSTTRPPTTTSTSTTTTVPRTTTTTAPPLTTTTLPVTTTTLPPTTTTTVPPTTTTVSTTSTTTVPPTTVPPTTAPPPTAPPTTAAPIVTPPAPVTTPTATTSPTTAPATTTTVPAPTTTLAPTSSTTPTTAPPTSSTTPTVPPTTVPPPPATVDAVNADGGRSGPPGVGLTVTGAGYEGCNSVYIFFDGVRIGTDTPDGGGAISASDLFVPGDAATGNHQIQTSCNASGSSPRARATFAVTEASVHRPAFVTALPMPDQVSLEMGRLVASAAVAVAILVLFAFPFELFNSTVESNYDEIRGWFRLPARAVEAGTRASRGLTFFGLTVITAIVIGFLSPGFGPNMTSLVTVVGFSAALFVMSVGFSLPASVAIHRQTGERGRLNFLPGTVLISIVMVALSRLGHWQPGYMYGALAGLAFASALSPRREGQITAANWVFALVISVAAFFLRAPVADAASKPHASVWWIGLEACLVLIFLWGIEGLAVAMLPMRFLDGRKVIDWNRAVWAVLMFVGVFSVVHVLLTPTSGYVGHTTGQVTVGVVVLFVIFGAISVGLWAYFRYRPERMNLTRARLRP